jgi:prolyl-tRNA synthetase
MLFSKLLVPTLRETPSDADIVSLQLMMRSGMVCKLASGFYEFLPLGLKALRKVENIIREEMNAAGGQEIMLPLISPKDLWDKTGRWAVYGKELFKLKDRKNVEFCLAPTAEESVSNLAKKIIKSYKQFPIMLYQFGTKFRDEIRPRFGLLRSREFLMKDAYSFHADDVDLEKYYKIMLDTYVNICLRCGFKFRVVEAVSGAMGGSFSHEFMILSDTGEDELVWCNCGYGATIEKASGLKKEQSNEKILPMSMEEIVTPNFDTVKDVADFLKLSPDKFIKTIIYVADGEHIAVLVRGDDEIDEIKLKLILNVNEMSLLDEQAVISVTNSPIDFVGPVGLKDVKIVADLSVIEIPNVIIGANKKNHHIKNVNYKRDYSADVIGDIRKIVRGDICPKCKKEELKFSRGIEIGHIFKLGTKYSKLIDAKYLDKNGKEKFIVMGCYGIGITRILAAIIEQSHDDNGIIWPDSIAPFEVAIVPVNFANEKVKKITRRIYKELSLKGLDVLVDDRNERAGIKFKDADLIGIPYRITIGEKNLANGHVELKARRDDKDGVKLLTPEDAISEISKIFKGKFFIN